MSIRRKLILAHLLITLLPVLPLYLLVKGFVGQSLEIGLNKKVERALEAAAGISQTLYSKYKAETLALAEEWAASPWIRGLFDLERDRGRSDLRPMGQARAVNLALYDRRGELLFAVPADSGRIAGDWPPERLPPTAKAAGLVESVSDPRSISAYAPVSRRGRRLGYLLVTRPMSERFARGSQQIVEVHQMFKTLGWVHEDIKRSFLLAFFAVYAPFAVLSAVLAFVLSRRITAPLVDLAAATQRVAEGDWDYRMPVRSKDELGQLVSAFNTMVGTLKENRDHLVALEKMAVWREIARILAHEIKNPLTPIQLTVQQMKDKYPGNDPTYSRLLEECTEIVNDEIDSLRTLVREFSEFARMPKLNLAPGDLNELVEEAARLYQDQGLRVDLEPDLPQVRFDYEKLRRALINLIDNGLESVRETPRPAAAPAASPHGRGPAPGSRASPRWSR